MYQKSHRISKATPESIFGAPRDPPKPKSMVLLGKTNVFSISAFGRPGADKLDFGRQNGDKNEAKNLSKNLSKSKSDFEDEKKRQNR